MFFGLDLSGWGITTWMPSYLLSSRGLLLTDSAGLLAIGPVVAGIATIVGGRLSDRLGGRPRLTVVPARLKQRMERSPGLAGGFADDLIATR